MSILIQQIVEAFPNLVTLVRGDKNTRVSELKSAENATGESLIFVSNPTLLAEAVKSNAKIWLVSTELEAQVPEKVDTLLKSDNVPLVMAYLGRQFFPQTQNHQAMNGPKISSHAMVSQMARLGADCIIGPGAVVGDHCVIGEHAIIGANAVLEPGVSIGARTHIHALVYIGHSCQVGADCDIHPHTTIGSEGFGYAQDKQFNHHRITHYGRVVIEDNVHLGAGVQIDRGTFLDSRVGSGTRIDNHCHFGHNIQIGRNTLITGGMITAGSVTLGSYCIFGGRTTVAGHLSVTDKVHVGGLSGIAKSIVEPGQYGGLPLQEIGKEMRTRASLKKLPDLVKQVRRILKHLGLENTNTGE